MARAVLFDIDGTLVDSVDLHVRAWREALARFGKDIPTEVIRGELGRCGDDLLPALLSEEELERFGQELDDFRSGLYQRQLLPRAQAFPGARELLARLKQGGSLVALASSCRRLELGYHLRMVGGASLVDAASTADDVERGRPSPGPFEACLEKLGLEAGEAVAVGDSAHDVEAAARGGVACVGVLAAGFPERSLREAGCVAVYQDLAELLARLPDSPLAPPQSAHHHR